MLSPVISIILLNWNGRLHIFKALEALSAQTFRYFEVVVVDNGSSDGSITDIQKLYPHYHYILNEKNLGFAMGMNQGIEQSTGRYVLPLNQDVFLHQDFLREAVTIMEENPSLGAVGALIYIWKFPELSNTLRNEGRVCVIKKWIQGGMKDSNKLTYTFGPAGSCPVFRKAMLEDIKQKTGCYFDTLFETGWEDFDLYFRMQLLGWATLFNPLVKAWHVGSGSVGGKSTFLSKSPDYQKRIIRNRWYCIFKNLPLKLLVRIFPWILLFELALPWYLLIKSPKALPAYFMAWRDFFKNFGILLKKRSQIQKNKVVTSQYLYQFFTR